MKVGGSMIIPMLISVEETTRSMIKNGRKRRRPISKAVFSSETMKAGISTSVATSERRSGVCLWARLMNSRRSSARVCLNMNSRSGSSARSRAAPAVILFWASGSIASLRIAFSVGPITKTVRKRAIPTSTWLGGALVVPSALRTKPRTTRIRVKPVTVKRIAGTSANARQGAGSERRFPSRSSSAHRPATEPLNQPLRRGAKGGVVRFGEERVLRGEGEEAGRPGLLLGVAVEGVDGVLADADEQVVVAGLEQLNGAAGAKREAGKRLDAAAGPHRPALLDPLQHPGKRPDQGEHDQQANHRAQQVAAAVCVACSLCRQIERLVFPRVAFDQRLGGLSAAGKGKLAEDSPKEGQAERFTPAHRGKVYGWDALVIGGRPVSFRPTVGQPAQPAAPPIPRRHPRSARRGRSRGRRRKGQPAHRQAPPARSPRQPAAAAPSSAAAWRGQARPRPAPSRRAACRGRRGLPRPFPPSPAPPALAAAPGRARLPARSGWSTGSPCGRRSGPVGRSRGPAGWRQAAPPARPFCAAATARRCAAQRPGQAAVPC